MRRSRIPYRITRKAQKIASRITEDCISPFALGGKKLPSLGGIISVPVTQRYRALFTEIDTGFEYLGCVSHERYNKLRTVSATKQY